MADDMPFRDLTWQELKRTPLTVVFSFLNLLVAAGSLLIAWTQLNGPSAAAPSASAAPTMFGAARSPNILVFVSASLGSAFSAALLTRLTSQAGFFVTLPFSLILAVSSILVSLLAALWVGLDPLRGVSGEALANLIFYGHLAAFFACNGEAAVRGIILPMAKDRLEKDDPYEGVAMLVIIVIVLTIWARLVGSAQDWLMQVLR